jgi:hypothetical protein
MVSGLIEKKRDVIPPHIKQWVVTKVGLDTVVLHFGNTTLVK